MKYLLLITLLLCSCSIWYKPVKETINPMDEMQRKGDIILHQIVNPYDLVQRCDGLTFIGYYDANLPEEYQLDIYLHEYSIDELGDYVYKTGQWNRDIKVCFEIGDSRSGISTEGILAAGHSILTRKDLGAITRLLEYGEANDWVLGVGPTEYTKLWFLKYILRDIKDKLEGKLAVREGERYASLAIENPITKAWQELIAGHKGNVVAMFIHLWGRVHGKVTWYHLKFLKSLVEATPESPLYQAYYHRYSDGDQALAISLLNDHDVYPISTLPMDCSRFDWHDCPAALLWLVTQGVIEGI
jgi:hypothetical protein